MTDDAIHNPRRYGGPTPAISIGFTSERQAKRFFIAKIVVQAEADGVSLSQIERQVLFWESADEVGDASLLNTLHGEIAEAEYEAKIAALIQRAWKRDVELDAAARSEYRNAFTVLSQGDHYLLVMIKRALGRELPWWAFWR